jgi:hypothetical protein
LSQRVDVERDDQHVGAVIKSASDPKEVKDQVFNKMVKNTDADGFEIKRSLKIYL